ncbi:MAG: SDR family NAD(P)-dependent oxidoreductase [Candidatus Taylorbacteria bacterium]|nr:SDR family NAD(P)-dependent oxidoreductase [Candidatus Taylorbacteria bacterium]
MKTALITGTSRGIGRALAERFIKEGWRVLGTAVSGLNIPDSPSFKGYDLDLSSPQSIGSLCDALISEGVTIDLLVNNAGVCEDDFTDKVISEKLRETFEVNVFGLADLTERLSSQVSDGGQIFNMSSTAGMLSKDLRVFNYPSYKMSKAALNMYTRILAGRLSQRGIFVASIHPGWVKTDMGGGEADLSPEEAAGYIYEFAAKVKPLSDTGLFWFKGERLPW